MAQMVKNPAAMQKIQEMQVWSLGQEDPLEEEMQPTSVFLPGKSHGQRNPASYGPWGHKELDTTEHALSLLLTQTIRTEWFYLNSQFLFLVANAITKGKSKEICVVITALECS